VWPATDRSFPCDDGPFAPHPRRASLSVLVPHTAGLSTIADRVARAAETPRDRSRTQAGPVRTQVAFAIRGVLDPLIVLADHLLRRSNHGSLRVSPERPTTALRGSPCCCSTPRGTSTG